MLHLKVADLWADDEQLLPNPVKEGLPTNRTELVQRYVSGGRCPTLA
jgi:hypothetical protein